MGSKHPFFTAGGGRTVIEDEAAGVKPLAGGACCPPGWRSSAERPFIFLGSGSHFPVIIELTWPVDPPILYYVLDSLPEEVHPSQD